MRVFGLILVVGMIVMVFAICGVLVNSVVYLYFYNLDLAGLLLLGITLCFVVCLVVSLIGYW